MGEKKSPTPSLASCPTSPERSTDGATARPFAGLGKETLRPVGIRIKPKVTRFLLRSASEDGYLPGQPRIRLPAEGAGGEGGPEDAVNFREYLRESHLTQELDELMPLMKFIFVQTPDYKHIYPLHHQAAHARKVILNEKPGLHLVWYYDRIFIKPIPAYFLSAVFWAYLANADDEVHRAAVGFMRSYYHLIQFEVDYDLACEYKLIPRDPEGVARGRDGGPEDKYPTYADFCRFIEQFERIPNNETCRRFHYGELRLTRINRAAFLRKGKLAYFHIYPQWGSYLRHFFAPVILVLGGASVILNAMQVNLNAQEMLESDGPWTYFVKASLYFPVVTIVLIAAVMAIAMLGAVGMAFHDLVRAHVTRKKIRKGIDTRGSKSHGMIY